MFDIMARYATRIAASRQKLADTWAGKNTRPAFLLSDVNYAMCGQTDLPDDYLDPAVMFAYQSAKMERHMAEIPDDYIPVFHPWYGTTVVPSALGAAVKYQKGLDPVLAGPVLNGAEDVKRLSLPDLEHDGQLPRVLSCIDYFRAHTDAPVCVTDCQGPLSVAVALAGAENLFVWMWEEPEAVHALMGFCTEVLIDWVTLQKKHAGHALSSDAYPHAIEMPPGLGGVAISDDDMTPISPEFYAEFAKPYNEKLFAAFGGGSLHFCGSARQQVQNILDTRHCAAINNFSMCDYEQAQLLRAGFLGRGAVMACDFNARDIEAHCAALHRFWSDPRGVVSAVFVTPGMDLDQGKYGNSQRGRDEIVPRYLEGMKDWLN